MLSSCPTNTLCVTSSCRQVVRRMRWRNSMQSRGRMTQERQRWPAWTALLGAGPWLQVEEQHQGLLVLEPTRSRLARPTSPSRAASVPSHRGLLLLPLLLLLTRRAALLLAELPQLLLFPPSTANQLDYRAAAAESAVLIDCFHVPGP